MVITIPPYSGTSVHGGDFKGIEQELDYIWEVAGGDSHLQFTRGAERARRISRLRRTRILQGGDPHLGQRWRIRNILSARRMRAEFWLLTSLW